MLFSKFNINKTEWLNLVFDGRNQVYGAYELRKNSDTYLKRALLLTFSGLTVLLITSSAYYLYQDKFKAIPDDQVIENNEDKLYTVTDVVMQPVKKADAKQPAAQELPKSEMPVKQVNFATPKVVDDVKVTQEVPTTNEIEHAIIGTKDINAPNGNALNDGDTQNSGALEGEGLNSSGNNSSPLVFADQMPEFPGGMQAWSKFLMKNLSYPEAAKEAAVQGKVLVSFIVERNGEITGLKILKGIGAGCDEEALRVIKKSPLWKPGMQNGRAVRVSYVIPVVFRLE